MQSFGKGEQLQVIIRDETLWCGYDCRFQASQNVFESSELQQDSVCANFAHTAEDDKIYMCLTSFDRNVSLHITI